MSLKRNYSEWFLYIVHGFKTYVNITFWNTVKLDGQACLNPPLLASGNIIREIRKLILELLASEDIIREIRKLILE